MKIAIFTDCYLDLTGGIVTAINAEKKELERRGHTVYVFSSAYPRSSAECEKLARAHIYPVPSCRIFGRGATPIARRSRVIEKYLAQNFPEIKHFDIYYIHYEAGCSIAGIRMAHRLHIPVVQVMHGREDVGESRLIPFGLKTFVALMLNWFHSWYLPHTIRIRRDKQSAPTLARALMWTLMVNHASHADLVISPSEHFQGLLVKYGVKSPVVALHHGVADELTNVKTSARTLKSDEPLRIIWHSRVSGEKRILPFLEALSKLPRSKYRLDVYGTGPDLPAAKTFSRLHRLSVSFHGDSPYDVIRSALLAAHLDVLASYDYDTFGMILIEAEAAGVPVFIADPALQEILPPGGYILSSDPSATSMAASLKTVILHPEMIGDMSNVMLASRSEVRISASVDKLEKIFKKLMKKS